MVQGTIDQFTITQLEDLIETLVSKQHPPRLVLDWNMGNLYIQASQFTAYILPKTEKVRKPYSSPISMLTVYPT